MLIPTANLTCRARFQEDKDKCAIKRMMERQNQQVTLWNQVPSTIKPTSAISKAAVFNAALRTWY